MDFYERLTKLMKEKGYSQAKLEKEIGISNGSISKWKRSMPTSKTLNKIANALGTTIDYLMGWDEEQINAIEEERKGSVDYLAEHLTDFEYIDNLQLSKESMKRLVEYAELLKSKELLEKKGE